MIASAIKSFSIQDFQHPSIISYDILRRLPISPDSRVLMLGIRLGLRTMYCRIVSGGRGRRGKSTDMSSAGSPPMEKNSRPVSSTKVLKVG
jgi:hypothetical protein